MKSLLAAVTFALIAASAAAAQNPMESVGTAYRLPDGRIVVLTPDDRVIEAGAYQGAAHPAQPAYPEVTRGYGSSYLVPVPVPVGPCAPAEPLPDTDPEGYAHRRQQRIREGHLPPSMRTPNVGQYGWECAGQPMLDAWGRPVTGYDQQRYPRAYEAEFSNAELREQIRRESEARRREIQTSREQMRRSRGRY